MPGVRLGTVVLAVSGVLVVGGTAFTLTVSDPITRARYTNIVTPGRDAAYTQRIRTWNRVIDDLEKHPLGHGLGTAGGIQQTSGRTITLGNEPIDNSYLLIAYQQGVWVALIFAAGLLTLLVGMTYRAVTTPDLERARLALACSAALAAFAMMLLTGSYIEALNGGIIGWLLAGVGAAQFSSRPVPVTGGRRPDGELPTPVFAGLADSRA